METTGNITFTIAFEIRPSIIPNHSIIVEKDKLFPSREVHHGPIPDVLVMEVVHELRESRREAMEDALFNLKRGMSLNG